MGLRFYMRDLIAGSVVALPIINEATEQGIVTVLSLESFVWLGITYGAWFKIGMAIALTLLIIERSISIITKIRNRRANNGG